MKTFHDDEGNYTIYCDSLGRLRAWHCEGPEDGDASAGGNSDIVAELLDADSRARADEFSGKPLDLDSVWANVATAKDGETVRYANVFWTAGGICRETLHRITPDGLRPAIPSELLARIDPQDRGFLRRWGKEPHAAV